ncbi:MAG: serine hydrolase domain-containing protein [Leucobacter sp.]
MGKRFNPATTRARHVAQTGSVALAVVLTAMFAGCAADPATPSTNTSAPQGSPELQSLSHDALEATLAASAQKNLVPGALALITTPEGSVFASYGTTALGETREPLASDVFRIGSVTKTMVAAVVLQQVGEQKLALTDPISQFVPGVPNGENITIADLLQMRSGLHNYLDTDGFASVFNADMTHVWTPEQLVEFGIGYPSGGTPGETFDYSNTNTTLLGLVAEQLDDKRLRDILHDRLFEPLGMADTERPDGTSLTLPDPMVQGYQYGVFPINHQPLLSAEEQAAAVAGTLQPKWSPFRALPGRGQPVA